MIDQPKSPADIPSPGDPIQDPQFLGESDAEGDVENLDDEETDDSEL